MLDLEPKNPWASSLLFYFLWKSSHWVSLFLFLCCLFFSMNALYFVFLLSRVFLLFHASTCSPALAIIFWDFNHHHGQSCPRLRISCMKLHGSRSSTRPRCCQLLWVLLKIRKTTLVSRGFQLYYWFILSN